MPAGTELCQNCRTEPVMLTDALRDEGSGAAGSGAAGSGGAAGPAPAASAAEPPLFGMREDLRHLQALAQAAAHQRQLHFALVVGAPGAGKSRLLVELARALVKPGGAGTRPGPAMRVFYGVAAAGTHPLGAMADVLLARFGIEPGEAQPSARDKILRACRAVLTGVRATEVAHLLGEILGAPFPESPVTPGGSARAEAELGGRAAAGVHGVERRPEPRHYLAIKRLLQVDAARTPLCLLFDEVEDASPEMVHLLQYLAAGLSGSPVLLCAFARPEIDEAHPRLLDGLNEALGEGRCARIDLSPLSADDSVALLEALTAAAGAPPPKVQRHVEEHLCGSPRAISELVRLLEDLEVLRLSTRPGEERPGWDHLRLSRLELPVDLEGLVAARLLDMEPELRDVLEKAAVAGERFFVDAVVAQVRREEVERSAPDPDGPTLEEIVVGGDRATGQVTEILRELEEMGLLRALQNSSIRGEREYAFAYPPWRDVIYEGIAPAGRRAYHRMLAQWLELTPDGLLEEMQETVGRHLEKAGLGDAAARRYRRAGDMWRDRYGHGRATRLYLRALACLGAEDRATRLHLWRDLGAVFYGRGDYDNALEAFEKVVRLSWVLASRGKAAAALLHMGEIWQRKGELRLSQDYLAQALGLFRQAGDGAGVADAQDSIGVVLWMLGRYGEALDHGAAALEARRRQGDKKKVAASLLSIGNIERHRGLFEEASACYREALDIHQQSGDKGSAAACLNAIGMLLHQRGDQVGARRVWEEALALAEAVGAQPLQAVLLCHVGRGLLEQGSLAEAEARFLRAQELGREVSDRQLLSEALRLLGMVALKQGDRDEALLRCERALELAEETGIRVCVGRALLGLGEVYAATLYDAASEGPSPAQEYFERGVALFREIGNLAELAQGLFRLGRYNIEAGETEQGQERLKEAAGIFSKLKMKAGDDVRRMLSDL